MDRERLELSTLGLQPSALPVKLPIHIVNQGEEILHTLHLLICYLFIIRRLTLRHMAQSAGLEPATIRLTAERSTN